ncbi:MAG: 30S ribosomal protein S9 [Planctomycetota bacterium]
MNDDQNATPAADTAPDTTAPAPGGLDPNAPGGPPTLGDAPLDGPQFGDVLLGGEQGQQIQRQQRDPVPADKHGWWWAVGRRKNAVARVRMRNARSEAGGEARVQVQKARKIFKDIDTYFSEAQDRDDVLAPLRVTETLGKMDIFVRVHGGGHTGQAQAIRLGIARALRDYDPTLEDVLREHGYLTVDARRVERKKPGQPGARANFQFSKR